MHITPIPNDIKNPYISLLYGALGDSEDFVINEIEFDAHSLLKNNLGLVHLHWLPGFYFIGSYLPLALLGALRFVILVEIAHLRSEGIIWTAHNKQSHECSHPFLEKTVRSYLAYRADKVIVHCGAAKSYYEDNIRQTNYEIIPHGNYSPEFDTVPTKEEARQKLELNNEQTTVLNFGTIRRYKRQCYIAELVEKELLNTEIYIVGRPWEQDLAADLREIEDESERVNVHLEYVESDDIALYHAAADFVILPYQNILTSGALLLALTLGKPIIAPNIGCLPEYITSNCGYLYNDDSELISILSDIDSGKKTSDDFSNDVIQSEVSDLSWDRIAELHSNVYLSILNEE
ncbi:glycosyltransferase [Halopenitus persicus]|uniref:Glycosyltransferase involved in cell wall bisynthesis n=1 Tax=Halopenitus persicus TaxID=1048396 RepID=A0A1H3P691_9EURY|nr:glycosyltransferase [Halopenitus persicus]SDY96632.1 Glycosyltransferase involved in cell wall bisynthesis [Halopenitus persicus]